MSGQGEMGDRIRDSLGCLYGPLKVPVSELTGKTIIKLEQADNWRELRLFCSDGTAYAFYSPRCQERKSFLGEGKYLEDVKGDLGWLLEAKVLEAGKADTESGIHEGRWDTFYEWEIYRLITEKGQVELRFLGVSDGWDPMYMEFIRIPQGDFWDAAWRGEETEGADVRTGAGEEAKAEAEANGETVVWCRLDAAGRTLRIRLPSWAREYGLWLEYEVNGDAFEPFISLKKMKSGLKKWLDQVFFPAESGDLVRDERRRAEFLTRIRQCGCRIQRQFPERPGAKG